MKKLLVLAALLVPSSAFAEPIVGFATFSRDASFLNMFGETIAGTFTLNTYQKYRPLDCLPCLPGETVDVGGLWQGPDTGGRITYQNQSFSVTGSSVEPSGYGEFSIVGSTVAPPLTSEQTAQTQAVFTLSGWFLLPNDFRFGQPNPHSFGGSGMATFDWVLGLDAGWNFAAARYDFVGEAPEPATWLLVGTGALVGWRFRHGHKDKSRAVRLLRQSRS